MTRWQRLQGWIFRTGNTEFTVYEYANDVHGGVVTEASEDIQDHLRAQRKRPRENGQGGSSTLYVLHRSPGTRTRNSRWIAGVSVRDARAVGAGFADDVKATAMQAFSPDLARIGELNPRARRQAEAQISQTVDHALAILESASAGLWNDEDDDDD